MIWTKEKIYISVLFCVLIVAIVSTLYFNRKDCSCSSETYEAHNKKIFILDTENMGNLEEILGNITKKHETISPYDIGKQPLNSSNMTPSDWVKIAFAITKVYNQYDAFIVIQGADTMSYSASALSFMMENLGKSVILTDTDINNLASSLTVASKYDIPEVVICSSNRILRGCRSTKVGASSSKGFVSPNYPLLGKSGVLNNKFILKAPQEKFNCIPINPKNRVIVVKLFPGIDDRYLSGLLKSGPVKGMVIETFGYGNAPTNKDFLQKLKVMIDEGMIVVSVSQCKYSVKNSVKNTVGNETETMLQQIGVITGMDMTTEAVLAKLHFLISNVEKPNQKMDQKLFEKLVRLNMRGEVKEN